MQIDELLYENINKVSQNLTTILVKEINAEDQKLLQENSERAIRIIWSESFLFCCNNLRWQIKNKFGYDEEAEKQYLGIEYKIHQLYINSGMVNDIFDDYKKAIGNRWIQYKTIEIENELVKLFEYFQSFIIWDISQQEIYDGTLEQIKTMNSEVFCKREMWRVFKNIQYIQECFFNGNVESYYKIRKETIEKMKDELDLQLSMYSSM
jgi:hypothetical protein